jgi:RNA polymerase sigma-70 factor (ECF subfamily)
MARLLESRLAALPEMQRTAFVLSRAYEFSYEEIAVAMNLSVGAVKSVLHRAKSALAAVLDSVA